MEPESLVTGTCAQCRYWKDVDGGLAEGRRECRRWSPKIIVQGGFPLGVWPQTRAEDGCGAFKAEGQLGVTEKVSAAQIIGLVKAALDEPGKIYARQWLVEDMMELGLARSSAVSRVKEMERRGELIIRKPAEGSHPFQNLCVWLPEKEPVRVVRQALANGRPRMDYDQFLGPIRKAAPTADEAMGFNALLRYVKNHGPIGTGTFGRVLEHLIGTGKVAKTASGLYHALPAAETLDV